MSDLDLTLAEIQALPVGSVVVDRDGDRYERRDPPPAIPVLVWYAESELAVGSVWSASDLLDFHPVALESTP